VLVEAGGADVVGADRDAACGQREWRDRDPQPVWGPEDVFRLAPVAAAFA
jgi:hypothetical protein